MYTMYFPMELFSGHVTSTLFSGQLEFRQPTYATTHWFTWLLFLQERSPETTCLPSTRQITLSQGLMAERTWWKNSHCHTQEREAHKHVLQANQRPCLNTGLHLTSLDLSFDSGLSLNGSLNICSQFTVELAAEKKFHLWFENAWNATQNNKRILHTVFLLLYRAQP